MAGEITVEQVRAQLQALGHAVPDEVIQGFLMEMDPAARPAGPKDAAAAAPVPSSSAAQAVAAPAPTTFSAGSGRTTTYRAGGRVMAPRPMDISASFGEEDTVEIGDNSELFHTWDEDDFMKACAQPLSYPTALGSPKRDVFVPHKPATKARGAAQAKALAVAVPSTAAAPSRRTPEKENQSPLSHRGKSPTRGESLRQHAINSSITRLAVPQRGSPAASGRPASARQHGGQQQVVGYAEAYAPAKVISTTTPRRQPYGVRAHPGGSPAPLARPQTAPSVRPAASYNGDGDSMISTRSSVRSFYTERGVANSSFIASPSQSTSLLRKKTDRVARYGATKDSWAANGVGNLTGAKKRPTTNFHMYFAQQQAASARAVEEGKRRYREKNVTTTTYVPPQAKRRDNLRWQVRCQMQYVDRCEPAMAEEFNPDDSMWEY